MRLRLQSGATLFAMLAVISLAGSAYMVSRVSSLGGSMEAAHRAHNAAVLRQAKATLLAYVAQQAAKNYATDPNDVENYPGRLPCPEPGAHVGNASYEGVSAPYVASGATTCSNIGRLPWRTIGSDKLRDAAGEPLWYAVTIGASGWALQTSSTALVINSNKEGGLTVNLQPNAAVAVIIAPGAAMNINPTAAQVAAGCSARTQNRSTTPPNYLDYVECHNVAANSFVTAVTGNAPNAASDGTTNTVFNDQVITITAAEVMAVVEPVVAKRIEADIVPLLKAVATTWGAYPFATGFADPSTSNYQGTVGTYQGLLPFTYSQSGTCSLSELRCTRTNASGFTILDTAVVPTITRLNGSGTFSGSCSINSTPRARCTGSYDNNNGGTATTVRMTANVKNAARALRDLDQTKLTVEWRPSGGSYTVIPGTLTGVFKSDGSGDVSVEVTLPYSGTASYQYRITIANTPAKDNSALDSTANTAAGWFVKNEWYRLVYYAAAAANSPGGAGCQTAVNCLTVANTTPSNNKRSLLILAGRSMTPYATATAITAETGVTHTRPNAFIGDFLEFANAGSTTSFEQQTATRPPAIVFRDTGTADAYAITGVVPAGGGPVYFRATNANTGAATLNAAGTGARPIVNADGTELSASQIVANAVVQVIFDGTSYTLSKRPFNDRIIVVETN